MSVRAYRVIKIDCDAAATFNLWQDEKIRDWLVSCGYTDSLNMDGCGIMDIHRSAIEEALNEIVDVGDEQERREEHFFTGAEREILEQMLADCGGEDYVQYYCF